MIPKGRDRERTSGLREKFWKSILSSMSFSFNTWFAQKKWHVALACSFICMNVCVILLLNAFAFEQQMQLDTWYDYLVLLIPFFVLPFIEIFAFIIAMLAFPLLFVMPMESGAFEIFLLGVMGALSCAFYYLLASGFFTLMNTRSRRNT